MGAWHFFFLGLRKYKKVQIVNKRPHSTRYTIITLGLGGWTVKACHDHCNEDESAIVGNGEEKGVHVWWVVQAQCS